MNMIEVNNLSKIYRLYNKPKDRLREIFSFKNKKLHHEFHALNNVALSVNKGQIVGIIGQNGSGKSTLLKIICGILQPTSGEIKTFGRIAALLELGAGFNPEFTGRENVYMNGALLGINREEIEQRFAEIEAFADIGEFIDQPVKVYSSGMFVRLAFAAAIHVQPDILIIDEALSVGDVLFQTKCFAKFREFKKKGVTIIFVTHGLDLVTTHCDKAILMDHGTLIAEGKPKHIVDDYNRLIASKSGVSASQYKESVEEITQEAHSSREIEWEGLFRINPDENRYGTRKAEILEAGIFTPENEPVQILTRNNEYIIKIKVQHNEEMSAAITAFKITNPKGVELCGTNTYYENTNIDYMKEGDVIMVTFRQKILINPGEYLLSVGVAAFEEDYIVYDRRFDYMPFQIVANQQHVGLFDPESAVEWVKL